MKYHGIIFAVRVTQHERSSGAHRIASFLRSHGWDIEVVDFAAHWPLPQLTEFINSRTTSKTIFYGFSTFFNYWNKNLDFITAFMKRKHPNVKTILGGSNVALTKASNIDYWVDSYGEFAMLELIKYLIGNGPGPNFDLHYMGSKKLIKSNTFYPAYPMPSYANILEKRDFVESYEWLTTEFSRGCIFNCSFCNFPVLGVKGDYSRTQEDFEKEMRYNYDEFGVKHYYVADETFNDRTDKIIKFADVAEKLEFRPFFSSFIRPDLLVSRKQDWEHILRLNMGGHYYGIESFNHESAKVIKKGMNPDKVKSGLLDFEKYMNDNNVFYRATISLISGLPYETRESFEETINWMMHYWSNQSQVVFPLDVEDIDDNDINGYTNVSEMGKNLKKFGIRRMQPPYPKDIRYKRFNAVDKGIYNEPLYDWKSGNYFHEKYIWEHDTMNVFEAIELAWRFQYMGHHFKADNWQLGIPFFYQEIHGREIKEITDIKDMNKVDAGLSKLSIFNKFLEKYINKKLNWRP